MVWTYVAKRLLLALPTLLGVSVVVFSLTFLSPGDVVLTIMGLNSQDASSVDIKEVQRIRHELALDQPAYVQFGRWLAKAVQGDLGRSYQSPYPVSELIRNALTVTLSLMFGTMGLAMVFGIPLGIISAVKRNTWSDYLARVLAITGVSLPVFWEALILILVFAILIPIFPISGSIQDRGMIAVVLPVLAIATHPAALIARMTRSSMLEVLGQDYIRTARSKGLPMPRVVYVHALRNAINPVVTVIGFQFGGLIGAAVVVENIFALPGLGKLLLDSIYAKDIIVIQGVVLVISVVFIGANLIVDLLYTVLDPRIRL
jgi:peptide/nickel transport system permease protein